MKSIKCIFAVLLGVVVGVVSACSRHGNGGAQAAAKNPATTKEAPTTKDAPATQPAKENDLPIRRPILE